MNLSTPQVLPDPTETANGLHKAYQKDYTLLMHAILVTRMRELEHFSFFFFTNRCILETLRKI